MESSSRQLIAPTIINYGREGDINYAEYGSGTWPHRGSTKCAHPPVTTATIRSWSSVLHYRYRRQLANRANFPSHPPPTPPPPTLLTPSTPPPPPLHNHSTNSPPFRKEFGCCWWRHSLSFQSVYSSFALSGVTDKHLPFRSCSSSSSCPQKEETSRTPLIETVDKNQSTNRLISLEPQHLSPLVTASSKEWIFECDFGPPITFTLT